MSFSDPSDERRNDLADRTGFDEGFLGTDVPNVPLPRLSRPGVETVVLPYTHFSVVLRPDRRLAAATAVGIDGAQLQNPRRDDDWRLDPRVPEDWQAGPAVYRNNSLDRGHLVRRLDPVWGAVAVRAGDDTFYYTNAAPQADVFNQGKQVWLGVEDYLLGHASEYGRRLVVLTGPVLHDADPPYRGIQVPLRFWKVAAFVHGGQLAATAYVLDQSPDLTRDAERALVGSVPGAPPPLGAFRTYQVPVADVVELTGLDLGPLPPADLMPVPRAPEERWRRLESPDDTLMDL
ncbi:DNA/RNA non-specific endonuclease [Streptomyces sp. MUM 203J]|uniref:DNA/RNA non-specific endonuclease n=1 Tax=Streptomyces sp. MUM 203J TaxID=2791990 RepID=UPI001F04FFFF|nr:DNA/RNA non-specific endonuclease [Streptomyces sp. MUM 203J]MCH0538921.1 DNA/RNA non-specific endonuclease [Streptomyces sp. MUM 203J]